MLSAAMACEHLWVRIGTLAAWWAAHFFAWALAFSCLAKILEMVPLSSATNFVPFLMGASLVKHGMSKESLSSLMKPNVRFEPDGGWTDTSKDTLQGASTRLASFFNVLRSRTQYSEKGCASSVSASAIFEYNLPSMHTCLPSLVIAGLVTNADLFANFAYARAASGIYVNALEPMAYDQRIPISCSSISPHAHMYRSRSLFSVQ